MNKIPLTDKLIELVLAGNQRAVSRLITLAENDKHQALEISKALHSYTGRSHLIGVTGPPGAGKSTLVDRLAKLLRSQDHHLGIIAVDPSSPFSGGALLGDRIRMNDLTMDPKVFIRSMSTRGHLGGLSAAVGCVAEIFEACGCSHILIETVGVGQSEVEIMKLADTTIVVSVPGLGDDIQMIKAGILEIGDILAVNKADQKGAEALVSQLARMQQLGSARKDPDWLPPIVPCSALNGEGVSELLTQIEKHIEHCAGSALHKEARLTRLREELEALLKGSLYERFLAEADLERELAESLEDMENRNLNPYVWIEKKLASYRLERL